MEISDQFSLLHYVNNQQQWPLPTWATFFMNLGKALATIDMESKRYTIALALPTRSYAAAFIGAGVACANLLFRSHQDAEYIEFIYSLPEGTSLKYYEQGKVKKAIKKELLEYNGKMLLGIQIEDSTTKYILPNSVYKLEVAEQDYSQLPNKQAGRSVVPPSELLSTLVSEKAHEFAYHTRIDGVIVGSRNTLKDESQLSLTILPKDGDKEMQGYLRDLFRVEGFNPHGLGHRFLLHSPSTNNLEMALLNKLEVFSTVIFDSALGFLKWQEIYNNQNWIVILDHTDANFSNAVAHINQLYIYRSQSAVKVTFPAIPNGMEIMFSVRDI